MAVTNSVGFSGHAADVAILAATIRTATANERLWTAFLAIIFHILCANLYIVNGPTGMSRPSSGAFNRRKLFWTRSLSLFWLLEVQKPAGGFRLQSERFRKTDRLILLVQAVKPSTVDLSAQWLLYIYLLFYIFGFCGFVENLHLFGWRDVSCLFMKKRQEN